METGRHWRANRQRAATAAAGGTGARRFRGVDLAVAISALAMVPSNADAQGMNDLSDLVGDWTVSISGESAGTATVRPRLDGRFIEVEAKLTAGPIADAIYLLGLDDRHGEHTVVAMDDTGSYWVTARGTREGSVIAMYGSDRDPNMEAMGLTKEFVIVLTLDGADRFTVETRFIDTRTPARTELPFLTLEFRRR